MARLLAEKMPSKVGLVRFGRDVSSEGMIGVLEGLEPEREVQTVFVGRGDDAVSLTRGPFDGWRSDGLPSIHTIAMWLSVPNNLEASGAAERIRDGISSIVDSVRVRGLERLEVDVRGSEPVCAAIRQLRRDVGISFTINTHNNWGLSAVDTAQSIHLTAVRRS